jgi:hypothetical protein
MKIIQERKIVLTKKQKPIRRIQWFSTAVFLVQGSSLLIMDFHDLVFMHNAKHHAKGYNSVVHFVVIVFYLLVQAKNMLAIDSYN